MAQYDDPIRHADGNSGSAEDEEGTANTAGRVRVLTPEERDKFSGLTLAEEDESNEAGYREYRRGIYVRRITLGSPWALLVLAAMLGIVFLVVLPFLFLVLAGLAAAWLVFRLLR